MHDEELGPSIPAFLAKLWKLVNDPETDDLICWSDNGRSFVISNTIRFTSELLPVYYKHNNLTSFIRQLNMYGFRKVISIDSGGLKSKKDSMEFSHTCFFKGHPYAMQNIKRKISTTRNTTSLSFVDLGNDIKGLAQTEVLAQVLSDVNSLKSKQANWDAKLATMKRENEALWRELAIFRQKHHKQEQIINKLIQFIVTIVRPSARNVPLRRRLPLMLNDTSANNVTGSSSSGPTIRELVPIESLLSVGEGNVEEPVSEIPVQLNSPEDEYIIPHFIDELSPANEDLAGTSNYTDTSYTVLSPETIDCTPAISPWIHIDSSDEASMVPIDPVKVNPAVAVAQDDNKSKAHVDIASINAIAGSKLSNNSIRSSSKKSKIRSSTNISKAPKKNAFTKKKSTSKRTKTIGNESKDLLVEALSLMEEDDLDLPNLNTPAPDPDLTTDFEGKGDAILKLLEDVVEQPTPTTSNSESAIDDDPLIQQETDSVFLNPESLAVVRPNTSYHADDMARELGNHVDMVQGDIDILKEFLKGDGYSLDANTLLELFNDDPMSLLMPPASENKDSKEAAGSELMTYSSPNLTDLIDMYGSTPCLTASSPPPPSPPSLETPVMTPASLNLPTPAKKRRM